MWIVALNAVHLAFNHRMMLRHPKIGFRLQMALKTGARIFSGVYNKFPAPTAGFDVLAAGPVAGFATGLSAELGVLNVHPCMRTRRKYSRDVRMTFRASAIAYVRCS